MSPHIDSNNCITTDSGGIDYDHYEKQARQARSEVFYASFTAFQGIVEKIRLRLSLAAFQLPKGPAASPCS